MADWRDIDVYDGEYQVNEYGEVRRRTLTYRNRYSAIVKPKKISGGYLAVWLGGRRGANYYIHRLVACAFLGPAPSDSHEVAHWDGDKHNNSVPNLRWATHSENSKDQRRLGRHPKLTQEKVDEIRRRAAAESHAAIAREFGVSYSHVHRIAQHRAWN